MSASSASSRCHATTQRQRGESEPIDGACGRGRAHLLLVPQLLRAPAVEAAMLHEKLLRKPAPVLNLRTETVEALSLHARSTADLMT